MTDEFIEKVMSELPRYEMQFGILTHQLNDYAISCFIVDDKLIVALYQMSRRCPSISTYKRKTGLLGFISYDHQKNYEICVSDNKITPDELHTILTNGYYSCFTRDNDLQFVLAFRQFFKFGILPKYLGRKINITNLTDYTSFEFPRECINFLKTPYQTKKSKQKKVDELIKFELQNPDWTRTDLIRKLDNVGYFRGSIEPVNNDMVVCRWFIRYKTNIHDGDSWNYIDVIRLYISDKDSYLCCRVHDNEWVNVPVNETPYGIELELTYIDPNIFSTNTKIQYFKDLTEEVSPITLCSTFAVYPEIEKLYRAGMKWVYEGYMFRRTKWDSFVKTHFGPINKNGSSIYTMLGVNKYQLTRINKYIQYCMGSQYSRNIYASLKPADYSACHPWCVIARLKKCFGVKELNAIDNKTFDIIFNYINVLPTITNVRLKQVQGLISIYPISEVVRILEEYENTTINHFEEELFLDTIKMLQIKDYAKKFKLKFSRADDIETAHNIIADYMNYDNEMSINNQYKESINQRIPIWSKWIYENDEFVVIYPKDADDIANEGLELRHCVKSYIPDVCKGKTNILFIRRKDAIEKPFFTVEISNGNVVKQVRGFANCSSNTVVGLPDFIQDWKNKCNLKLSYYV